VVEGETQLPSEGIFIDKGAVVETRRFLAASIMLLKVVSCTTVASLAVSKVSLGRKASAMILRSV
jgi:hypothetical protein